jgi:hypothetical protein
VTRQNISVQTDNITLLSTVEFHVPSNLICEQRNEEWVSEWERETKSVTDILPLLHCNLHVQKLIRIQDLLINDEPNGGLNSLLRPSVTSAFCFQSVQLRLIRIPSSTSGVRNAPFNPYYAGAAIIIHVVWDTDKWKNISGIRRPICACRILIIECRPNVMYKLRSSLHIRV